MTVLYTSLANADWQSPTQPTNAWGVAYSERAAEIFWSRSRDDTGVVAYRVYRGTQIIAQRDAASFYDNSVAPGVSYSYQVSALDAAGNESARSNVISLRTPGGQTPIAESIVRPASADARPTLDSNVTVQPSVPGKPVNMVGAAQGNLISISWMPPREGTQVEGYNVYQNNRYIDTVAQAGYSTTVGMPGSYRFYAVAFDASNNFSVQSSTVELIVTDPVTTPPAPAINTANNPASNPEQTDAPVEPGTDSSAGSIPDTASSTATNTQTNPVSDGSTSTGNISPQVNTISSPASLTAELSASGSTTLAWEIASGQNIDGFNVYRDGTYLTTVFDQIYADDSASSATQYNYQIVAFDFSGNFSTMSQPAVYLPTVQIQTTDVSSVEEDRVVAPAAAQLPDPIDAYNSHLEMDIALVRPDGLPSKPRHLRVALLSNNWAELDWTPSSDDGAIVAYKIYRDDGTVYTIEGNLFNANVGRQAELDKYWATTSFIDCNYTRFSNSVHNCAGNQPEAGDTHLYFVTAIDDDNNESAPSNTIEVTYYEDSGAPIVPYTDIYLEHDDRFPFETDFSRVDHFIDQFSMVFEDEFNQAALATSKWNTSLTWNQSEVINGEEQYFVDTKNSPDFGYNPFVMTGETLLISAIPTPEELETAANNMPFLSGALSSHDLFGLTYGYVEANIKVGEVPGMLSSFYLFRRWAAQHAPEIDIVEYLANNPYGEEEAFETYHYHDPVNNWTRSSPTMSTAPQAGTRFGDDFHTYGVLWEPGLVVWYIDGEEVKRLSGAQIGRQEMNIVLYLVTGSDWTPAPDAQADIYPLQFEIDYVRAWQRPPYIR